jgi:hypothetical protein
MQLFGREVSLLYLFTIPYLPLFGFGLLFLVPLLFVWLLIDTFTNGLLRFFPTFRIIGDFMFPYIKVCPSVGQNVSQNGGQNGGQNRGKVKK